MIKSYSFIHPLTAKKYKFGMRESLKFDLRKLHQVCDECVSDNRADVSTNTPTQVQSIDHLLKNVALLRKMKCFVWRISAAELDNHKFEDFSEANVDVVLFIFPNGDVCVVSRFIFEDYLNDPLIRYKDFFPEIKKRICAILENAGINDAASSIDFDRPVHTVMSDDLEGDVSSQWKDAFLSEGLNFSDCQVNLPSQLDFTMYSGWSFSAIRRTDYGEEYLFVGLMVRLQLYWLELRDLRSLQTDLTNASVELESSRGLAQSIEIVGDASFSLVL